MLKTPLAQEHEALGARMVEFAGWYMPIQYQGLKEEHLNVRKNVGLFDVSHMGEIRFKGPKALSTLEWLTTNSVAKLQAGEAQYSLLPNLSGGLVDDIIVYCVVPGEDYLVCVNAANKDKDFAWMKEHNRGADIQDESSLWGQIAVQGPKALELLDRCFPEMKVSAMKSFTHQSGTYKGFQVIVARTGYTGEDGGEIFVSAEGCVPLWRDLLAKGADLGVQPIGLGARDTLRTEKKYSLYGHEIDDDTNPYEAGLGWVVKPDAKDFLGRDLVVSAKGAPKQKLIGLKMIEKGIPRQGYAVFSFDNKEIGRLTSGTHSPSLDEPIGIAYVASEFAKDGTEILVDIRGRKAKARVCKTPFVGA